MSSEPTPRVRPSDESIETVAADRAREPTLKTIGHYHIKRVIASGGMGTVYEATQDNPRRVVAVKVMKQGITSKSALRRFEYEGQILGRLRHPGIAQIYEAGTHHDPAAPGTAVPYFAMEYIPNAKLITKFAEEKKLSTRERMELFAKVCDAVHHGHQKGIIHRDLKPGNILVDSHGEVKVIDFGVARGTDSDLAVTMQQTDIGQLIGTLQYMSPEQCEGDPHDIDTRSDVYALGMVFYELLCSKLPYDVTRMAMHQATRAIRELHPTKLSTLDRTLRGDVETIALKALEKERERRYQSAADFGHDIHRYLTGEAILARRASIVYQLRLFARRNKAVFASLAATFVVLLAGIIVSTTLYVRAEHARVEQTRERERAELAAAEAQRERDAAQVVTKYLTSMLSSADPQQAQGREVTVRELLDKAAQDIPTIFRDQPLIEATLRSAIGRTHIALGLYEAAEPHLRRALEIRHKLLGDDHPDTLTTMYDLGIVLHDLGRLAEAEPLYRVSLEGRRRILGAEHPETLMSIDKLSWLFEDQGKLAEAEPLRWQVVEVRRRVLGPEDLWTLTSEGWLAKILVARGKFSEGERVYRATLDTQRRVFGDDHWRPLYTIGHLARALRFAGKLEEAESLYRLSLPKMRTVLGAEHPDLAYSLTGLGLILADTGRAAEAEPMLLEALELRRGRLPAGHWEIAITENALGFCYASLGRYQAAESLLLPSFSRVRQALGEEHVETRDTLGHVVQLYDAWDAAEPGKGYAEKAAQWRAKLDETSKNQNVETPQRRNAAIGNVKKISERIIRRFRRWTQIKRAKQQKICEKLRNLRISCCCSST